MLFTIPTSQNIIFVYNNNLFGLNLMGSEITIDKHTTGIDEWLDIN